MDKTELRECVRHGFAVCEHKKMDLLRKEECLCLNCAYLPCDIAKKLYEICKEFGNAMAMTRCANFKLEENPDGKK